jgi:hypothetical protein
LYRSPEASGFSKSPAAEPKTNPTRVGSGILSIVKELDKLAYIEGARCQVVKRIPDT